MSRIFFFLFILLLSIGGASAQQPYSATVVDRSTGAPVAYANVGLPKKGQGTVSDSAGRFTLDIPADGDTLVISMVGYSDTRLSVKALPAGRILLSPKTALLREVVVKARTARRKWVGNRTRNPFHSVGLGNCKPGYGIGVLMDAPWLPCFLEEVRFNVDRCSYDSLFLRLVLLKPDGGTFTPLLEHPVYIRMAQHQVENGFTVDLRKERIAVSGRFLVGLEVIEDLGPGDFGLSARGRGAPTYIRLNSGTGWSTGYAAGSAVGISAQVTD